MVQGIFLQMKHQKDLRMGEVNTSEDAWVTSAQSDKHLLPSPQIKDTWRKLQSETEGSYTCRIGKIQVIMAHKTLVTCGDHSFALNPHAFIRVCRKQLPPRRRPSSATITPRRPAGIAHCRSQFEQLKELIYEARQAKKTVTLRYLRKKQARHPPLTGIDF